MALKFVDVKKPMAAYKAHGVADLRQKFIDSLNYQKQLIEDEKRGKDNRQPGKRIRRMYFNSFGTFYVTCFYGPVRLKLDGEHETVEAGNSIDDLFPVLDEIITMAETGTLDEMLNDAAKQISTFRKPLLRAIENGGTMPEPKGRRKKQNPAA